MDAGEGLGAGPGFDRLPYYGTTSPGVLAQARRALAGVLDQADGLSITAAGMRSDLHFRLVAAIPAR